MRRQSEVDAPTARPRKVGRLFSDGRWRFPLYLQLDQADCGPACLRMVAKHHGRTYSSQYLRDRSFIGRDGVSLLGISEAAELIGIRSLGARISFDKLDQIPLPCIAHWRQSHFVVIYRIKNGKIYLADPARGLVVSTKESFLEGWAKVSTAAQAEGIILALEPTPDFYRLDGEQPLQHTSWGFLITYVWRYKSFLVQLILGLLVASLLSLIFPFLMQAIVDIGIDNQDLGFVYLLLLAQLMLFAGRTAIEFIRNWILLHIGIRINISIISDFLIKLMRLPMSFFDTRMIGDILQRIQDHNRIERFLASTTLEALFSIGSLVVYSAVLLMYSSDIFLVFLTGGVAAVTWTLVFMKKRRELDMRRFGELSDEQSKLIQLITGMQEIKLNSNERQKRWEWEHIQARLFKTSLKGLGLAQYQEGGTLSINELKNIVITFLAARAVIDGTMTLGMMLAAQYIVGQLNAPIVRFINFLRIYQDAKISLERLGEIHCQADEEDPTEEKITFIPHNKTLYIHQLSFQYEGPRSPYVLRDLTMEIPQGKVTAVVGGSGSGKTTLLKLLLKFYPATTGTIGLGETNLANVKASLWRARCGVVMQDGFMFNDTIARNIALGAERLDKERFLQAVRAANIDNFIESLPLGYNTRIGMDGAGISQGQRQRILIARAIYKDPEYLFFDEATSSLDANNERVIMENLATIYESKTVVVIAHRLSTVRNADQIVVLDKGSILERGTHAELTALRGAYYDLVKNQLELGA